MAKLIEVAGLIGGIRRRSLVPGFVVTDREVAHLQCGRENLCDREILVLTLADLWEWESWTATIVTCPVHGMKFDVTTGCFAGTSDFGVAAYPAKVVDGKIMVEDFLNCSRV